MQLENVISLFDGMSCFQLALQKLGIKPKKYFASEIDKFAMQVTMHNFPVTIYVLDQPKKMTYFFVMLLLCNGF